MHWLLFVSSRLRCRHPRPRSSALLAVQRGMRQSTLDCVTLTCEGLLSLARSNSSLTMTLTHSRPVAFLGHVIGNVYTLLRWWLTCITLGGNILWFREKRCRSLVLPGPIWQRSVLAGRVHKHVRSQSAGPAVPTRRQRGVARAVPPARRAGAAAGRPRGQSPPHGHAMDCSICFEKYDQQERVPKVVPCGHTVCLLCLGRSDRRECPTCRTPYKVLPSSLPRNFDLLRLIDQHGHARVHCGWCSDCRDAAKGECWEEHEVLNVQAALRRRLQAGVLQQAAGQLEALHRQCQGAKALHAMTLLSAEPWDLTLRSGDKVLTGTVRNADDADPLTKAMWLTVAAKAALTKVERLVGVHCCYDPAWSLQLLRSAAPSVEQLSVWYLRQAHMLAVHAMPRLRRLWLSHYMEPRSLELGELPQQGNGEGLEWLKVYGLPRPTTRSVLQAHAHSLQELVLFVGTAGEQQWPRSCSDLHSLLEQCGLRALRRVVLERGGASSRCSHGRAGCDQQRGEVRRVLHGAEVLCSKCHHRRARPYCRL
ncbi:uncharacterized protein LOC113213386 isoform X2 [Frankliniella occidentalis]|uniref:Uncharacterized protein LOC113213386 isoform X2 n=1 Tax=Frankliniella occidentalis TaxID=133901 RepID=A0A6J1T976_FRAOC|nr:uncharacterized protein LOC113213386 isoform X2 [Frankliniella occidentalis]